MTPDLSYTTEREGESSARIINGMGKKAIQYENIFQTSYVDQPGITAGYTYSGGIPIQFHSVTSRSRRALLLFVVRAIYYGCSCMPRHVDVTALVSRTALSLRHSGHQLLIYRLLPEVKAFCKNCGRMANLCRARVVFMKPEKRLASLVRFHHQRMRSKCSANVVGVA